MELQLVGAVALGAAGATGVLLTLARRGAAPWLHSKRQKGDGPTNGSLLSSDESKDSNRCTHRPRRVWSAVAIIRHVTLKLPAWFKRKACLMFTTDLQVNAGTQLNLPRCACSMHHHKEMEDSEQLSLLHVCQPPYTLDR